MKKIKLILLILPIFLISGCSNYRELNDIAIVSALGIDKSENGYKMVVQVMNTKKEGQDTNSSGQQPKFTTYKTEGNTIQKMLRDTVLESPRRLYMSHMQLLIISEDLAKESINDILDWFARDSESRKQFYVLISRNDQTEEILNTLTAIETLNSKKIVDNVNTDNRFLGVAEDTTFENILSIYLNDKQEMLLPSIKTIGPTNEGEENFNIEQSSPDTKILLAPMAVFKNDKLVGYLTEEESIAMSFIKNKIDTTIIEYKCNNEDYIASEIINSKTKLEVSSKGKNPELTIKINGSANINEINCHYNLEDHQVINKVENMLNKKVEKMIKKSIKDINKKYNSDIYGFEDIFYKDDPKYYQKIKNHWSNGSYSNLNIKVNSNIKLLEKGTILKVIDHES